MRGFDIGERAGFQTWSGSVEWRAPLALIGRGYRLWPVFIDRVAFSAFADAGGASCSSAQRSRWADCVGNDGRSSEILLSAGGELSANVAVLSFFPTWVRGGLAFPLRGGNEPRAYFALGPGF